MSTSGSKSYKTLLSHPDDFSGVKGSVSFKTWWRQVRVMFEAEPKIFTDDKKKVLFATSCMKGGSAGLWADNYTEEQFSLPSAQRWSFVNFETTLRRLRSTMRMPNARLNAGTFAAWKAKAIEQDQLYRQREACRQRPHLPVPPPPRENSTQTPCSTSSPQQSSSTTPATGTFSGQGLPMDVDACRCQGLCFKCGRHGHLAKNCLQGKPAVIRAVLEELPEEDKEDMKKWLGEKGF
ncbi:hypothetical protein C8R48DRAFT_781946 [Suillus tomentosus]|nr:hypothetical protein C8R48DRAFT_781946 [Suillus tomentosus]